MCGVITADSQTASRAWKRRAVSALLLIGGLVLASQGLWIQAKAQLAQVLLQQAWQRTLADGQPHKPWPWADHWPVAQLSLPDQSGSGGNDIIVLEGDGGNVLAFAPGHNPRSGLLQDARTTIISAHRDTHFSNLGHLQDGQIITLQTATQHARYVIEHQRVIDSRQYDLNIQADQGLLLVTCWPFNSLNSGGPMRYLVSARRTG